MMFRVIFFTAPGRDIITSSEVSEPEGRAAQNGLSVGGVLSSKYSPNTGNFVRNPRFTSGVTERKYNAYMPAPTPQTAIVGNHGFMSVVVALKGD